MRQLDSGERDGCVSKRLEAHHRSAAAFDRTMILFNKVMRHSSKGSSSLPAPPMHHNQLGVVMLLYLKQAAAEHQEEGLDLVAEVLEDAICRGAVLRVRPKDMTVAAAMGRPDAEQRRNRLLLARKVRAPP
jgi:hypothetical protein